MYGGGVAGGRGEGRDAAAPFASTLFRVYSLPAVLNQLRIHFCVFVAFACARTRLRRRYENIIGTHQLRTTGGVWREADIEHLLN